jgi:hypothetical protein
MLQLCGANKLTYLQVQVPARCTVKGEPSSVSVQQVRALSALQRVREVPVKGFPLQCPRCVPLPVPVVRFFLVLHMYNRSVLQYCRYKKRADTNEPRTNEIPFNIKD